MSSNVVVRAFNSGASQYNQLATVQQRMADAFFSSVRAKSVYSGELLDIGCGTGFLTKQVHSRFPESDLVALDAAPDMLACLPDIQNLQWVCADFDNMPFADNRFSALFSSAALQWSQQVEQTLAEWLRVLKPGGELCFSTLLAGTLVEWDHCWESVGDSRRVNRLLTADQMQAIQLPVGCEWQSIQTCSLVDYHLTSRDALASVRDIGAGKRLHPMKKNCLMGRKKWQSFLTAYENRRSEQGLPLTYEVFYGTIKKK